MRSLRRQLHTAQDGATTVEWALVLAAIGLPLFWVFMMVLDVIAADYRMVTFLETLPFP
ncbi:MAG: hypothetical protein KGY99_03220 [Phycisphaerae bacterium]|nr:hypothetical protein [Phycisphaerae bacterium]